MPFFQKGDVRIRYEEAGPASRLLVHPGSASIRAVATGRPR